MKVLERYIKTQNELFAIKRMKIIEEQLQDKTRKKEVVKGKYYDFKIALSVVPTKENIKI